MVSVRPTLVMTSDKTLDCKPSVPMIDCFAARVKA